MSRRLPMPVPGFGQVLGDRLGRRYAAGPDPDDAVEVAADLRSSGRFVTCEYVAHPARTAADADAAARRLGDLVHRLGVVGLARDETAGQPAVDLLIPGGVLGWGATGEARLRRLCGAAAEAGTCLSVRPSSVSDVDACLDVVDRVREEFEDTGIELWASLRRTSGDLAALLPLEGADGGGADPSGGQAPPRVLLRTTGEAARVPGPAALPTAMDIDRAFVRYAKRLLGGAARPIIAAPDATLVAIVQTLADQADQADQAQRRDDQAQPRDDQAQPRDDQAQRRDAAAGAAVSGAPHPAGSAAADVSSAHPRPIPQRVEFMIDMGRRGDEVARLSATGRAVRVKVPFGPRWRTVGLRQLGTRSPRLARFPR